MREIKFRQPIFDNVNKEFHKFHYWGFIREGEFAGPTGRWTSENIQNQYTGLKDKLGKEIYCSDLIKTPAGTGEVIWEDGCYRIYWNHRDNTTLHDTKSEQMEVVGNKYEGLQNAGKGDII